MDWLFEGIFIAWVVGAAIWLRLLARRAERLLEASRHWPSVTGQILKSRIVRSFNSMRLHEIDYAYRAGGRDLRSSRIGFAWSGSAISEAEVATRYPVGGEVTVWYDPANPEYAVVERSGNPAQLRLFSWAMLAMAVLVAGFTLIPF